MSTLYIVAAWLSPIAVMWLASWVLAISVAITNHKHVK